MLILAHLLRPVLRSTIRNLSSVDTLCNGLRMLRACNCGPDSSCVYIAVRTGGLASTLHTARTSPFRMSTGCLNPEQTSDDARRRLAIRGGLGPPWGMAAERTRPSKGLVLGDNGSITPRSPISYMVENGARAACANAGSLAAV